MTLIINSMGPLNFPKPVVAALSIGMLLLLPNQSSTVASVHTNALTEYKGAILPAEHNKVVSEWQEHILDRIDSFGKLKENWDSYGGNPIKQDSINLVKSFVLELNTQNDIAIFPVPNGNIQLELENDKGYLELEFLGNNQVKLFSISDNREEEIVVDYFSNKSELIRKVDDFGY